MKFTVIPPDKITELWPHISPLVEKATSLTPDKIAIQDVLDGVLAGAYLIWAAVDEDSGEFIGTVTTRIINYPRTKALAMDFIGGTRMKEWLQMAHEHIEDHAKRNGCTHLEGYGRRAWLRHLQPHGWKQAHITYMKDLRDE
tara:strand:+ start:812 stop:1237 length:426 start_codon:yes stop_codon:yes gene_type:complete